uniref:Uncharacterized protein n=1 Tax=Megaviridae environmental sample TaxID=1737588 RepID=A0A5J6VI40_9VIRU|nr:MAG: hypothetical protein [Megaviridae environmental sample]
MSKQFEIEVENPIIEVQNNLTEQNVLTDAFSKITENFNLDVDIKKNTQPTLKVEEIAFKKSDTIAMGVALLIAGILWWLSSDYGPMNSKNVKKKIAGSSHTNIGRMFTLLAGPFLFGLIDNAGLTVGMSVVDTSLKKLKITDMFIIGMIGNAISDFIGSLCGGSVSSLLVSWTGYDGPGDSLLESFGITLGCLFMIPIYKSMKSETEDKTIPLIIVLVVLLVLGITFVYAEKETSSVQGIANESSRTGFNDGVKSLMDRHNISVSDARILLDGINTSNNN